jgi:Curlin associated repeat
MTAFAKTAKMTAKFAAAVLFAVSASALTLAPTSAAQAGGSIGIKIKPKGKDAQKLRAGLKIMSLLNGGDPTKCGSATVIQQGKGHTAKVKQKGKCNNAGVIQVGKNTNANIEQNGNEDELNILAGF